MPMPITRYLLITCLSLFAFNIYSQSNSTALEFIENKGQWNNVVTFKADFPGGAFFLRKTGFTVLQHHAGDLSLIAENAHGKMHLSTPESALVEYKSGKRENPSHQISDT